VKEIENLDLIMKVRKGGKKKGLGRGEKGNDEESSSSDQGKKY
jgi:hypothetical protein